jgi:hypothetical protein
MFLEQVIQFPPRGPLDEGWGYYLPRLSNIVESGRAYRWLVPYELWILSFLRFRYSSVLVMTSALCFTQELKSNWKNTKRTQITGAVCCPCIIEFPMLSEWVATAGASSGCRCRRTAADEESNCKYWINSHEGGHPAAWQFGEELETALLQGLGLRWILYDDISNGKWTWDLELRMSGVPAGQVLLKQ